MISKYYLRALVESIILEGFKDDQRYLVEKYPDHAQDLSRLQPKWIAWLIARFGESPRAEEMHPFEDAIVTVLNFSRKDAAIGDKYRSNEQFRTAIDSEFPPDTRSWKSPADPTTMTVDEMETILGLSERKKERFSVDVKEDDMESDRVGKVGPWSLWMPTTRERSCKIAGYDPVTRKPKTTWCTARMAGSNLFYHYVGRAGHETTLFYVIRDDPKGNQDWLSVGFVNGEVSLTGEHGGISVDRANDGLTPKKLQKILGSDHDEIMRLLTEKNKSLGGEHPARQKIKDAAQSVAALKHLTTGLSEDEASDLKAAVTQETDITPEVLTQLAGDKSDAVRVSVAWNENTPSEVLTQLADDKSGEVRSNLAGNKDTPPEILARLAGDKSEYVRNSVAANRSTPADVLGRLADDEHRYVRTGVASNPATPPNSLMKLVSDPVVSVRLSLSQNKSAPPEILKSLMNDVNVNVISGIASNPSITPDIRLQLANYDNTLVRAIIAVSPLTPPEILAKLAGDPDEYVRRCVAQRDSTPRESLKQLAGDKEVTVRVVVAGNPSTPPETLQKLTRDRSSTVRNAAKENLAKRQQLNERRLRQLIRQML